MIKDRYNLDKPVSRLHTLATQYEELEMKYGRTDLRPLWIADMDFAVCPAISDALARRVSHPVFGYTTAPASFWSAITSWLRRRHGWTVPRSDIDFLPGVKKGLGLALNYFTRPGDSVVIQPPVYHSFRSVITGNGRVPLDNPLVLGPDGRYSMDLESLEKLCAECRPKAMIVCNPHNPIGIQWPAEVLAEVAGICRRHGMLLISDEIYGDMVLDGAHYPTATVSDDAREVCVTIGAPSKTFNIPGISSAWTVVHNPDLRDGFFRWLLASEFDTPPLFAVIATEAAYSFGDDWLDCVLGYIRGNAAEVCRCLGALEGVRPFMPEAGFGLWVDFGGLGLSHDDLMHLLVDKARVAVSDGVTFGPGGEGFVRINIGVSRSVLMEGIDAIVNAVKSLR
ncbi:MAG: pyridoxal phosphate-dependent aminotransferase [Muribaculaceae bacterium]|nr:pyridoxal phosphate-dependent aminotransferase [Muribaculaceae bacterium]